MNNYRNKFEIKTGKFLKDNNVIFSYESEKLKYVIESNYVPDFIINKHDGGKLYIETKGNGRSFDGRARQKLIAVKNQHPEIDLRIVFFSDGKFGATRKDGTRQTQCGWAAKNGFKCAVREIPESWLE